MGYIVLDRHACLVKPAATRIIFANVEHKLDVRVAGAQRWEAGLLHLEQHLLAGAKRAQRRLARDQVVDAARAGRSNR